MQPTLNPWLVSYVSQYHQTKSRYEIDRYLIEVGYEPRDIEAVWQSLNPSSKEETRKASQKWECIPKMGKALRRASLKQLIFGAATILVLFLAIIIIFDPILPILHSPHTKIKYATSPTAKLSPDGKLLAVGTEKIEIWNVRDQKMLRSFDSPSGNFWWSNDSQYLALDQTKGTIQIRRGSDGVLVRTLENHSRETAFDSATEVIFNSDKNLLVWTYSYSNNVTRQELWQINEQSRILLKTLNQYMYVMDFSPDKSLLALSADFTNIQFLRTTDGILIKNLSISGSVYHASIAFGFDNETLAVGLNNGTIELWRINETKLLLTLNSSEEGIGELAFSPDGQLLASTNRHSDTDGIRSSSDKSIKLWRVSDGALIKKFDGHSDVINDLLFSADGQTLISTSWDKTLRFWPIK